METKKTGSSAIDISAEEWIQALRLVHDYAYHYDGGDLEALAGVLMEDMTFDSDVPSFPVHTRSRAEIIAALQNRKDHWSAVRRKHFLTNFHVVEYQRNRIRTQTYLFETHTRPGGLPEIRQAGLYDDIIVKDSEGKWRFAARKYRTDVLPAEEPATR